MTRAGEAGAAGAAPTAAADAGLEGWTLHAQYACRHDESEVIEERGDMARDAPVLLGVKEYRSILRRRPKVEAEINVWLFAKTRVCFFSFFPASTLDTRRIKKVLLLCCWLLLHSAVK